MHDVFLAEKICNAVILLCAEKNIRQLSELEVGVHTGSHVYGPQLAAMLKEKQPGLVGEATCIWVFRDEPEQNAAVIRSVKGMTAGIF